MNDFTLLELIDKVRKDALPKDWRAQRKVGERKRGWSRQGFDELLFEERPKIETGSFLKTVYIYQRHNETEKQERAIDPKKVEQFLDFIFHDIATPYGWPEVVKTFREFQGGKFYDLIRGYEANFNDEYKITRSQRERAGATEGKDEHTQLLQLAIKAKESATVMKNTIENQKKNETNLKSLLEEKENKLNYLKERIAALEAILLGKGGDQKAIKKEIDQIKKNLL